MGFFDTILNTLNYSVQGMQRENAADVDSILDLHLSLAANWVAHNTKKFKRINAACMLNIFFLMCFMFFR